jgi:membrane associated rhomboid family serine protease
MHINFTASLNQILTQGGYTKINMPADFSRPETITLWGRESGSLSYFYITYDMQALGASSFPAIKAYVSSCLNTIAGRIHSRHIVAFNILIGDICPDTILLINSTEHYALIPEYHMYYAIDSENDNRNILYHPHAPTTMDKSLQKIQAALNALNMPIGQPFVNSQIPQTKSKPIFSYGILGINIMMFMLLELTGGSQNTLNLLRFGAAQYHLAVHNLEIYRFITPIFLHIGLMHLAFNGMWLIIAGVKAERYMGHARFVVIYLLSGIVGNIAMMLLSPMAVGAGASGSIFGILGALLAFTLITKRPVENFNATTLGTLIIVSTLMGFAAPGIMGTGVLVANSAHIGGLITGFILSVIFYWNKKSPIIHNR